jgi:hypothetical protein
MQHFGFASNIKRGGASPKERGVVEDQTEGGLELSLQKAIPDGVQG